MDNASEQGLLGRWTFEKGPPKELEVIAGSWEWRSEHGGVMVAHPRRGVRVLLPLEKPQSPFLVKAKTVKVNERNSRGGASWCRVTPDEAVLCAAQLCRKNRPEGRLDMEFELEIHFDEDRSWINIAGKTTQVREYPQRQATDRISLSFTNQAIREIVVRTRPADKSLNVKSFSGPDWGPVINEPEVSFARGDKKVLERNDLSLVFDDDLPVELTPLKQIGGKPWRIMPPTDKFWGWLEAPDHALFLLHHNLKPPYKMTVYDFPAKSNSPWEIRLCGADARTMLPYRCRWRMLSLSHHEDFSIRTIYVFDRQIIQFLDGQLCQINEYDRSLAETQAVLYLQNARVDQITLSPCSEEQIRHLSAAWQTLATSPEFKAKDYPAIPLPPPEEARGESRPTTKP
jgi:hypothetical protein